MNVLLNINGRGIVFKDTPQTFGGFLNFKGEVGTNTFKYLKEWKKRADKRNANPTEFKEDITFSDNKKKGKYKGCFPTIVTEELISIAYDTKADPV